MNGYFAIFVTLFLICFSVIEGLLWVHENRGVKEELGWSVLLVVGLVLYLFYGEASEYARENKALLLLLNDIVFVITPLWLILLFNRFHHKLENIAPKHTAAVLVSAILGLTLPMFALITSCFTGLDCL